MKKIYVGTSGWVYSDWQGIFYPKNLSSKNKLRYFSQHFNTTEVNYSFYHLPKKSVYSNWYQQTTSDFLFSVKASRFITHIKRLKGIKSALREFLENASQLKEKLGSILFQFPSSFRENKENIKRLKDFLKFIRENRYSNLGRSKLTRYAFEFRDKSWCQEKIYELLKKYNGAWVIADSSRYPKSEAVTADFVYIRMHGPDSLFSSKYSKEQLKKLAQKIKKWRKAKDIFVYFNNDVSGYAVENAKTLKSLLEN